MYTAREFLASPVSIYDGEGDDSDSDSSICSCKDIVIVQCGAHVGNCEEKMSLKVLAVL